MEKITGSEALMQALKNEGVKTIFGYPGGSIMPVYDALYDYTRGKRRHSTTFWYATSKAPPMQQKAMRAYQERWEYAS